MLSVAGCWPPLATQLPLWVYCWCCMHLRGRCWRCGCLDQANALWLCLWTTPACWCLWDCHVAGGATRGRGAVGCRGAAQQRLWWSTCRPDTPGMPWTAWRSDGTCSILWALVKSWGSTCHGNMPSCGSYRLHSWPGIRPAIVVCAEASPCVVSPRLAGTSTVHAQLWCNSCFTC